MHVPQERGAEVPEQAENLLPGVKGQGRTGVIFGIKGREQPLRNNKVSLGRSAREARGVISKRNDGNNQVNIRIFYRVWTSASVYCCFVQLITTCLPAALSLMVQQLAWACAPLGYSSAWSIALASQNKLQKQDLKILLDIFFSIRGIIWSNSSTRLLRVFALICLLFFLQHLSMHQLFSLLQVKVERYCLLK